MYYKHKLMCKNSFPQWLMLPVWQQTDKSVKVQHWVSYKILIFDSIKVHLECSLLLSKVILYLVSTCIFILLYFIEWQHNQLWHYILYQCAYFFYYIVTWWLKARMVELEQMSTVEQWTRNHSPATTNSNEQVVAR
jgi:hypothetical protein